MNIWICLCESVTSIPEDGSYLGFVDSAVQGIVLLIIQKAEVQSAERSCKETDVKTSTKQFISRADHSTYATTISKLFTPYFAPPKTI